MEEEERRYEEKGRRLKDEESSEGQGEGRRSQKGKGPEVYDLDQQDHLHEAQQEEEIMWRWQISQEVRALTELCHQQKLENTLLQQELHERRAQEHQRVQQEKEQKELANPPSAFGTPEEQVPDQPIMLKPLASERGRVAWGYGTTTKYGRKGSGSRSKEENRPKSPTVPKGTMEGKGPRKGPTTSTMFGGARPSPVDGIHVPLG